MPQQTTAPELETIYTQFKTVFEHTAKDGTKDFLTVCDGHAMLDTAIMCAEHCHKHLFSGQDMVDNYRKHGENVRIILVKETYELIEVIAQ